MPYGTLTCASTTPRVVRTVGDLEVAVGDWAVGVADGKVVAAKVWEAAETNMCSGRNTSTVSL